MRRSFPKKNLDVREALIKSDVAHWELAKKLNMNECVFCRKLRNELTSEEKYKLFSAIQEIVEEREVRA